MQSIDDFQLSKKLKEVQKVAEENLESNTRVRKIKRPRIVILGTGWGAYAFLKTIDATMYDIVIISPRNYFLFTPMLAASAVGTVEFRSITEPIRNVNPLADYVEAQAIGVDSEKKIVQCQSVKCEGTACDLTDFDIPYDHLIVSVGATSNTFGIKGVRDHCQFLKQIEDAASLRKAIAYCFERASVPSLSIEEQKSALSFIVVGAGPTGVEFTAELRDFMETEGRRYYPDLLKYVRITLVEASGAVLQMLDETLQREALKKLLERKTKLISAGYINQEMVRVLLNVGVSEVKDSSVLLNSGEEINYGFCVWAAGNGPVPLVLEMIQKIPQQQEMQSKARGRLVTDSWLRVEGVEGIYSFGDCSYIDGDPLPATAQVASQQGAYLGRLFSRGYSMTGLAPTRLLTNNTAPSVLSQIEPVSFATDRTRLGTIGLPVEGEESEATSVEVAKPFQFLNLGVLAYIGASEALAEIAVDKQAVLGSGPIGFFLWRGIYWSKQVSWRNRVLVTFDWIKGRLFGRDIGALYL